MPIKSKVFIQTLQKSQDRHIISVAFEFNNKNSKKVFVIAVFGWGRFAPPPIKLELKALLISYYGHDDGLADIMVHRSAALRGHVELLTPSPQAFLLLMQSLCLNTCVLN